MDENAKRQNTEYSLEWKSPKTFFSEKMVRLIHIGQLNDQADRFFFFSQEI